MTTNWSDKNSEDSQDMSKDQVSNCVALGVSLLTDSFKQNHLAPVATETASCHNNTITIDDVAILEKECDSLSNMHTDSSDESYFDEDSLKEAYQHMYSHWLKIMRKIDLC